MAKRLGIYKRGDVFWMSHRHEGARQWISLQTTDLAEAITRAQEIRDRPITPFKGTICELIPKFIAFKKRNNIYSRDSQASKFYILRLLGNRFPDVPAASISDKQVQLWYDELTKEIEPSTAESYVMAARSFFKWCIDIERIRATNPARSVRLIRVDRKARLRFCTVAQRDALIANTEDASLKFILYCGFYAGLRKNEIIEARADWFDLKNGLLHVRKTNTFRPKDRDERSIPLAKTFAEFLRTHLPKEGFCLRPDVRHGLARYRYDFRFPFEEYVKAQEMVWVTPHVMRHTFASILASRGVSIFKISEWLGDDVRVTQRHYAKLLPGDRDIEKLIEDNPPAPDDAHSPSNPQVYTASPYADRQPA